MTLTGCCLLWPEESEGSVGTGFEGCRLFGHHPENQRMGHKGDPRAHLIRLPPLPAWPRTLTRTTGSRPRAADVKGPKVVSTLDFLERVNWGWVPGRRELGEQMFVSPPAASKVSHRDP